MKVKNKKNLSRKYIITLFSLLTLLACSTIQIGKDFKLQNFSSNAQLGKTSKEHVLEWLGKPMSTGVAQKEDGERLDEWGYFYGSGQLPNMENTKLKTLQIRFDKEGIIRSYNWTGSK